MRPSFPASASRSHQFLFCPGALLQVARPMDRVLAQACQAWGLEHFVTAGSPDKALLFRFENARSLSSSHPRMSEDAPSA